MQIEIRSDSIIVRGYVNAVERDSRVLKTPKGNFVEQVRSGVWQDAIKKNDDIPILLNHNWNRKLGSTKDNLKLKEDNIGLYAEARILDKDVIEKAKNDKLVGWSFGFKANKQSWGKTDNDRERRYLDEITLFEVSILDNTRTPAYYGTSSEARDDQEIIIEERANIDEIEVINTVETREVNEDLELKMRLLKLELEL